MSLFTRVLCTYWSHPKTARLRQMLGNDALWIPIRLWSFAADHRPSGVLEGLSAADLSSAIGYGGSPRKLLRALIQTGFLDEKPLQIHNWGKHNWYHSAYNERAKKAAAARWEKGKRAKGERDSTRGGQEQASLKDASSMFGPIPAGAFPSELKGMLEQVEGFKAQVLRGAKREAQYHESTFTDDAGVKRTVKVRGGDKLDAESEGRLAQCNKRIGELKAKLAGVQEREG